LCVLVALILPALSTGCGAPPATMELIAVARKGLADASTLEKSRHAEALSRLDAQKAALDSAFDADARLVEAGKIQDAAGKPLPLSAEWVISARRGYAAARDALAQQRRRLETENASHLDNLSAADEALAMAGRLILQHYALAGQARQIIHALGRRLIRE
jgi:hypothetical protein